MAMFCQKAKWEEEEEEGKGKRKGKGKGKGCSVERMLHGSVEQAARILTCYMNQTDSVVSNSTWGRSCSIKDVYCELTKCLLWYKKKELLDMSEIGAGEWLIFLNMLILTTLRKVLCSVGKSRLLLNIKEKLHEEIPPMRPFHKEEFCEFLRTRSSLRNLLRGFFFPVKNLEKPSSMCE